MLKKRLLCLITALVALPLCASASTGLGKTLTSIATLDDGGSESTTVEVASLTYPPVVVSASIAAHPADLPTSPSQPQAIISAISASLARLHLTITQAGSPENTTTSGTSPFASAAELPFASLVHHMVPSRFNTEDTSVLNGLAICYRISSRFGVELLPDRHPPTTGLVATHMALARNTSFAAGLVIRLSR